MRYLCFAAIVLALPLTVAAEQRHAGQRGGDGRQSQQHQGGQAQQRQGRQSDQRHNDARPTPQSPLNNQMPAWEQRQMPWWERQSTPRWEQPTNVQHTIPLPNWATTLNGRALMDRDKQLLQHGIVPWQVGRLHASGTFIGVNGGHQKRQYQSTVVYTLPPYGYYGYGYVPYALPTMTSSDVTPAPAYDPNPTVTTVPLGALRLEVEPRDLLQIFVDGAYVGTPADLDNEIELTPGTRRIELRARGYKTLVFNVEIAADRMITYRGALEPDFQQPPREPAAPVVKPATATGPKTIYVIPGCYLGNVEPKASDLRAGCDIGKMTTTVPK